MTDVLNVTIREEIGSNACKKIRTAGLIPAVLYGHGEGCVNLSVSADELNAAIRHRSKMVNLAGGVRESALISEIQWDAFGATVLHLDLTRVSASELVQVTVPLQLRGEAPGTHSGGVVEHTLHEVELECPASAIPDKIVVTINSLQLEGSLKVSDLDVPEGAKLCSDPEAIVVQCVERAEESEEDELGETAEPEVIGRKAEESDEG